MCVCVSLHAATIENICLEIRYSVPTESTQMQIFFLEKYEAAGKSY